MDSLEFIDLIFKVNFNLIFSKNKFFNLLLEELNFFFVDLFIFLGFGFD
jgi:hypothetical protein